MGAFSLLTFLCLRSNHAYVQWNRSLTQCVEMGCASASCCCYHSSPIGNDWPKAFHGGGPEDRSFSDDLRAYTIATGFIPVVFWSLGVKADPERTGWNGRDHEKSGVPILDSGAQHRHAYRHHPDHNRPRSGKEEYSGSLQTQARILVVSHRFDTYSGSHSVARQGRIWKADVSRSRRIEVKS